MPDANYLGDEEDLMPPLSEEDLLRMYGPSMAPPAVPAGYPGDEQDFHPSSAPMDTGDDEHESGPPIAPRGAGPASDPGFTSSIDWLKKLQGERPVEKPAKWWQKVGAAAAGGLAGYSNAAGRTRHPIDIAAMSDNILHPGYHSKLQEWQSKVVPAEAIAKLEGEKQAAWWKGRAANTEEAYKQAETARANQQGKMYENRANQERNRFSVDSKTGAIFDRATGEVKTPPPTMAERKKMALEATGDEGMANFYAINGNLTGYGSTLATPKADHKPSSPSEVLMDPDATPEQKKIAQGLFDKEHRAPAATNLNFNVNPAALDQAADMYAATGQMPAVGFGKDAAVMRSHIMNRAAELHPDTDLASAKTDYGANQGAIKGLEKQKAQILTFENTAAKNLDLADSVSQRVDRSGSPAMNRLLLHVKGQYAGDTDTQLLNNAVETAASEYAKVVSGGTSGPVSDSARQHAREMLTSAMGKGTFSEAVKLMKQEMGNRRSGYDDQLKELRSGRKGNQAAAQQAPIDQATPPLPAQLSTADVGKFFTDKQGKKIKITAVNPQNPKQFRSE